MRTFETTSQASALPPSTAGAGAIASVPLDTLSFAGLLLALVAGGLLLVLNRSGRAV